MSVDARFDGKVFVPDGPVDLPIGQKVRVEIEPEIEKRDPDSQTHLMSLERLLAKLEQLPENSEWPADGAAQHDHYLYGTPKRP
jgi:hypothetical protein